MSSAERRGVRLAARFATDDSGNVAMIFAVVAVVLFGLVGAAVDYANLATIRATLQTTADATALAAAQELRLGTANSATISQVAQNFAQSSLATMATPVAITPAVDMTNKTVSVDLGADVPTYMTSLFGSSSVHVETTATAKVVGGAPICVIGLNTTAVSTILMDKNAALQAPNCSVYSNSTKPAGLMAMNYAVMTAAFICSAGGKSAPGPGSFKPTPQTDCPVITDPLASRPTPSIVGCLQNNRVVSGITTTLEPGTYCGGLTITNGANVTLDPGTYAFVNGPLVVDGASVLNGTNVGLFFSGTNAVLDFEESSTISLTAPKRGDMTGMLVFEDRASPPGQTHQILSDNARMLLGTIYLPQGQLYVAANKPVADLSAYTIIVANTFALSAGPTMVLNTNYGSTDIPVPAGVGPNGGNTMLTQ